MANVKQGNLTAAREWWQHLDWLKRPFWKGERRAQAAAARDEAQEVLEERAFNASQRSRSWVNEDGDTIFPEFDKPETHRPDGYESWPCVRERGY